MVAVFPSRTAARAEGARRIAAVLVGAWLVTVGACGGEGPTRSEVATPAPPVEPPAPPPPPPPAPAPLRLTILDVVPRTDTFTHLGFEFAARIDGSIVRGGTVYVDSGTATQHTLIAKPGGGGYDTETLFGAAFAPGPGRHRFTIVATDTGNRAASASFERMFVIPDEPYAVTSLPDLGAGGEAAGISARGDVAGWVVAAGGRRRPAVWRGTTLTIVPASDSFDVVAKGVNATGDVLLQYDSVRAGMRAARVRRADGVELVAGPYSACCDYAVALTEDRRALTTSVGTFSNPGSVVLDVARGTRVDSTPSVQLFALNARGHTAGVESGQYMMAGRILRTFGFTAPALPVGHRVTSCDQANRFTRVVPLALDDAANLLADYCGNVVFLPSAGASAYVDRFVGRTLDVELSRQGGAVAGLDSSGTVHLWRVGAARSTRVRPNDDRWRLERLAGVTGDGVIAATGVDATSGRRAALRLTPIR